MRLSQLYKDLSIEEWDAINEAIARATKRKPVGVRTDMRRAIGRALGLPNADVRRKIKDHMRHEKNKMRGQE